jgi:hypothetical protein
MLKASFGRDAMRRCACVIGVEGASALADALKVNTSVNSINLGSNGIGDMGALALADALEVNMSVTGIDIDQYDDIDMSIFRAPFYELMARNKRLRHLFLFDARHMLLSVLCADECGAVWPYLFDSDDADGIEAPANIETLRAEFAAVVARRSCNC